jgi:FCP1-like phosphatase family protein
MSEFPQSCPHASVWMGLCAQCGAAVEAEEYVKAPGFITLDAGFRVKRARVLELEQETLSALKSERKGVLVFDLDHTLIHVTLANIETSEGNRWPAIRSLQEYLASGRRVGEEEIYKFDLDNTLFYLKVRPGIYDFLDWCNKRFHLYVYTHGTVPYASVILKAIDPKGELFGERVIARESIDRPAAAKQLSRIFPTEHKLCLVIDDRRDVWTLNDHDNLLQVAPYLFFPDKDREQISIYGALKASLHAEAAADDQQLDALREVLDRLVAVAFGASDDEDPDVRPHLVALKSSVLGGKCLMTSGIIPVNEQDPWSHPVSVALRELGAVEPLTLDEVEILVASSPHTEKAKQVEQLGGQVVKPEFLLYALSTLKTPDIRKFLWNSTTAGFWASADAGPDDLLNDLLADLS